METIFWLILFVVLLIIEIFTMGLTTVWFAGGALVAFILAFAGLGLPVQIIVFLLVSILLLVLTRPIAIKFFNQERQKTNADRLIGQRAVVLETIDTLHGTGRVEVNGMEWSAKVEDPIAVIEAGTVVSIEGIQGVKLIVKKEED
ncbi:MAG: NfeD family protein [Faecalimonas sp.]|nr:NfeD family protein [Faecalimonas sp.]